MASAALAIFLLILAVIIFAIWLGVYLYQRDHGGAHGWLWIVFGVALFLFILGIIALSVYAYKSRQPKAVPAVVTPVHVTPVVNQGTVGVPTMVPTYNPAVPASATVNVPAAVAGQLIAPTPATVATPAAATSAAVAPQVTVTNTSAAAAAAIMKGVPKAVFATSAS